MRAQLLNKLTLLSLSSAVLQRLVLFIEVSRGWTARAPRYPSRRLECRPDQIIGASVQPALVLSLFCPSKQQMHTRENSQTGGRSRGRRNHMAIPGRPSDLTMPHTDESSKRSAHPGLSGGDLIYANDPKTLATKPLFSSAPSAQYAQAPVRGRGTGCANSQ